MRWRGLSVILKPTYAQVMEECEEIASCLHATAPIRVDVRRLESLPESRFAAFDINMKLVSRSWCSYLYVTAHHGAGDRKHVAKPP